MARVSLLPAHSGAHERVHSDLNARILPHLHAQADLIRTLWDPWTCPVDQLPLLAWAWSVEIWSDSWPVERKRLVIAESPVFHKRKTTLAGYRMALGYIDAELVRAHLPRHGFVAATSPTPESHAAWLSRLPEIRIYPNEPRIVARRPGFYAGRRAADSAGRTVLDRRRAELRRNGVVTPLVFMDVRYDSQGRLLSDPERLMIPAPLRRGLKAGGPMHAPLNGGGDAGARIITLGFSPSGDPFLPNALPATLTPVNVTPIKVFAAIEGKPGLAAGRNLAPVRRADEDVQLYDSIRLVDGSTAELRARKSSSAAGIARVQDAPFIVRLLVHAPVPRQAAYVAGVRPGPVRRPPEERVREVHSAAAAVQSGRDTVFVDVNSTRRITFGDLQRLPRDVRAGVHVRI